MGENWIIVLKKLARKINLQSIYASIEDTIARQASGGKSLVQKYSHWFPRRIWPFQEDLFTQFYPPPLCLILLWSYPLSQMVYFFNFCFNECAFSEKLTLWFQEFCSLLFLEPLDSLLAYLSKACSLSVTKVPGKDLTWPVSPTHLLFQVRQGICLDLAILALLANSTFVTRGTDYLLCSLGR